MTSNSPLPHGKNPLGLRIIGIAKLVSASLLLAVAFGIFHLLGTDTGTALEQFVRKLHLDPDNRLITKALAGISGISRKELKAIDAGTFLYASLYIVEGVGLLLAKHWAEYLTIIATASLIPVEIYEIVRKISAVRIAVLLVNIAIVAYLIYRLRTDRRARQD
jgi:uncharacterized membrane protein (DUF2068 family)